MISEFKNNYAPFNSPDLEKEYKSKKEIRQQLKIGLIQHAVGEFIKISNSLYPHKKMITDAVEKISSITNNKVSSVIFTYFIFFIFEYQKSAKESILRRLKYLRNSPTNSSSSCPSNEPNYFFTEDVFNQRRKSVLKNNHKNRLEFFSKNYSFLSSLENVIFYRDEKFH